jgi:hypothetical protein
MGGRAGGRATCCRCTAELERLLALKDLLERDVGDKTHAAALDTQCLGLAEGKYPLQVRPCPAESRSFR